MCILRHRRVHFQTAMCIFSLCTVWLYYRLLEDICWRVAPPWNRGNLSKGNKYPSFGLAKFCGNYLDWHFGYRFSYGKLPDRTVAFIIYPANYELIYFFIFFLYVWSTMALSLLLPWGGWRMNQNAEWWMSQLPHRWRTQQTAKRNAICRTRESSNFWTQVALAGNPASMSVWVSLDKKH